MAILGFNPIGLWLFVIGIFSSMRQCILTWLRVFWCLIPTWGAAAADGNLPAVGFQPVSSGKSPVAEHPQPALLVGPDLILGASGESAMMPSGVHRQTPRESPGPEDHMDVRLHPFRGGVLVLRTGDRDREFRRLLWHEDRLSREIHEEIPPPEPDLASVIASADEAALIVAATSARGLEVWSLREPRGRWEQVPLPEGLPKGQAVGLAVIKDRILLCVQAGGRGAVWSMDRAGSGLEVCSLPPDLSGRELALFPLAGSHVGIVPVNRSSDALWSLNLITKAWTTYPLPQGTRYAGPVHSGPKEMLDGILLWKRSENGTHLLGKLELLPRKPQFGWINYTTLAAYLLGTMGIGLFFMFRTKSTDDYFLGGGRVPWWAAGISVYATMLSPITVMAMSGKSYLTDWTFLIAPVTILLLAPVVMRWYLPFFRQLKAASAYAYLEQRFHGVLRAYAALAFILFQVGRMAIVIFLPSLALSTVVGLDIVFCILLMGGVCTVYTMLGGIEGVIWNDVLQTVVMLGSAVVCIVFVAHSLDGTFVELAAEALRDHKVRLFEWSFSFVEASTWIILMGGLINNLVPYTSDQTVIQRYMTTRTEAMARRSIWLNGFMSPPSALVFFLLGTGFYLFYKHHPEALHPSVTADSLLPYFVHEQLPLGITGIVIAGIFAASQSSVSSSLNSVATVLVTDLLPGRTGKRKDTTSLWLARICTVLTGMLCTGVAVLMAERDVESFFDAYLKLVAITGSGLAGLFTLGIFSAKARALSAGAGVICSAVMVYFVQRHTDLHFFFYGLTGFATCLLVGAAFATLSSDRSGAPEGLTWWTRRLP